MEHDTKQQQNIYGSSDIATLLKVKESTLRKYTLLLEKAGYKFHKNDYGQRGFYDHDVIALKKMIEIKKHPDMTLEQACNAVMTWVKENDVSEGAINDITPLVRYEDRYNNDFEELKQLISQQTELIKEFSRRLDQQQKYIDERLEQRDKKLMESLRESQEVKQQLLQIAAAQEEKQQEEEKKGFFARLFGK